MLRGPRYCRRSSVASGTVDEVGEAYRGVRLRVSTLVTGADVATLDTLAPAHAQLDGARRARAPRRASRPTSCPGNLDGVGSDPWAAAQVERSRERTCEELLAEWDEHGPVVDEMAAQFGRAAGQLLSDATTHEHDVRGALGAAGARDSDAVVLSFGFVGLSFGEQLDAADVGAIMVHHGDATDTLGSGEPVASLAHRRLRVRARADGPSQRRADRGVRLGRQLRARAPRARPVLGPARSARGVAGYRRRR